MTIEEFINRDKSKKLWWNDPDPIEFSDYIITHIEDVPEEALDEYYPISIEYNKGSSAANVFVCEIQFL